ncbi:MAG: threonine--tRNA ligase [Candidatus Liptonbacteria bacterium]|nr:threonine--tRNA ligase [Candidatus Liptonbacteria bacterium]MBI3114532.1 threonine--tRNA ligase [Candidatus Harrisonbacteria bacterium]
MKPKETESLDATRHSLAHLLAMAVRELYPGAQNAIGPAVENGFYQDFDFSNAHITPLHSPLGRGEKARGVQISDADLPAIEKKMRELLPQWKEWTKKEVTLAQVKKEFAWNAYKMELAKEFAKERKTLTFYVCGGFVDLCKGGHTLPLAEIDPKSFKLDRLAGAYWRGDEKNKMLTRIYGLAFATKKELDKYLTMREEAERRDHRKLGQQLDLFTLSEQVGKGLPLFTPKGALLRELLNAYSQELREKKGWQKVWTPHITKSELYKTSGHWDKFGGELFLVKSQETKDELVMKPMNCPHHQQIYASRPRSYRDLPLKYMETTTVYRDEKAGELLGLSRVRCITQDDSHTFCRPNQIEQIYQELIDVTKTFYKSIGMQIRARLSLRDQKRPDKYLGEPKLWEEAQRILLKIAKESGLDYFVAEGEAAFYGPKIDFMAVDALGREWQLATPQLDFVQPKRFGLTYTDETGKEQTPVMIHFALMGSIERFLSVYIEHTAGAFPLWLSPVQATVIPISDKFASYGAKVKDALVKENIRVEMSDANETLGKRIRAAELMKIPYILVVGEKEEKNGTVNVRRYRGGQPSSAQAAAGEDGEIKLGQLTEKIRKEITEKQYEI